MKQTAYFTYQLLIYVAIALMIVPGKLPSAAPTPLENTPIEIETKVVATEDIQEDILTDILFRF